MVVFGLLLLLLGVVLLLLGVFSVDLDVDEDNPHSSSVEILRVNVDPEWLFVAGVVTGALILLGLWFMKAGTQRGWQRRKEQKRLEELSEKLDRVEAERRAEAADDDAP